MLMSQSGQQREHVPALAMHGNAVLAAGFVGREADRDRAVAADRLLSVLDHLADQAHPVLEAAAVFVGSAVGLRRQEMGQQVAMGRIDVDDVEARLPSALRRLPVPAPELPDVRLVHGPRLIGIAGDVRHAGHVEGDVAAVQIGRARAAEPKLDAGQRAVRVHRLGRQRVGLDVAIVPKARVGKRQIVGGRTDRAVLGADHAPAALRLHAAKRRQHARPEPAEPGAMGHLIKAVLGRDGDRASCRLVLLSGSRGPRPRSFAHDTESSQSSPVDDRGIVRV